MRPGDRAQRVKGMRLFRMWDIPVLIALLAAALLVFLPAFHRQGSYAEVYLDGALVQVISLEKDGDYRIEAEGHYNLLQVRGGRICVSEADCPDGLCMDFGWKDKNGEQIICLPHRLTGKVVSDRQPDHDVVT